MASMQALSAPAMQQHAANRASVQRSCRKPLNRIRSSSLPSPRKLQASRRDLLLTLPILAAPWLHTLDQRAFAAEPASGDVDGVLMAAIKKVVKKDKAPVLLRLVFHDAGTYRLAAGNGGPNGSIQYELERPESFGLKRGWRVIQEVRKALKGTVAEGVSDGDLIAVVGAYVVAMTGGPQINVPLGRPQAASQDPDGRMLSENASSQEQKAYFESIGLSLQDAVALLGAHTLGNKGYGDPLTFDNTYFVELLKKPWTNPKDSMASMIGIPSDHVLPDDEEILPIIQQYAADQSLFFDDFASAYVKMTSLGTNLA